MRTELGMKTRRWMRAGLVALLMGVAGGAGQAWSQSVPVTRAVKTAFSYGEPRDLVVASVVETGVRTGQSQTVTLQLLDHSGVVVAQTTGVVDQDTPLRLTYRTPSEAPVFARAIATVSAETLSAAAVTVERWSVVEPASWTGALVCYFELVPMPRPPPPPPGPVTLKCEPVDPPPPPTR
ncbi:MULTISPECIES: hypothetical protein [unclassified Myxococcus]|uniref:hypothetical protein n=1 Tax=unclassified Myxococcus TaxID=2648731 RepID=UPI001E586609|nr:MULTISPECIES: hypothetical protein [unclassified Myxococcus]